MTRMGIKIGLLTLVSSALTGAATVARAAGPATPTSALAVSPVGMALGIVIFGVVGAATIWLGVSSDILRDSKPTDFGGAVPASGKTYRRPYSLAQTQMAWWFCVILASYLYIAWTNAAGATPPNIEGGINAQALILLGIGTGTALGASMIEQMKSDQLVTLNAFNAIVAQIRAAGAQPLDGLVAQRDALAKQLASEGFLRDILSDVDGISLHRFQSFVWTLVLGGMFLANVVMHNAMPQFSPTLLALLGISGGTYLGFKIPEQPS